MTEYIDRDMLIAEDWHMERTVRDMTSITIEVKRPIDFPAADVVEVVRCKDCAIPHNRWTGCPQMHGTIMEPYDYCSYGKRKEVQID